MTLTTHVLDLSVGKPASDVLVELWLGGHENEFVFLKNRYTNEDGRLDEPFLAGENFKQGIYELRFHVGDYYRKRGLVAGESLFFECVPVRFVIHEPGSHYHVPLLISPGGYSTYRGS